MKIEIRDLKKYEDYYLIDNIGNVISKPRLTKNKNQFTNIYKVLTPKISKHGYLTITLCVDNKLKTCLLHRLVAEVFIPNPKNLPCVNHKDGNKLNNYVDNLEWVSYKDNSRHAYVNNVNDFKNKCIKNLEKLNEEKRYVKIILEKNGIINEFDNSNDASKFLGCAKDNLTRAIKNNKKCCGYIVKGFKKKDIANEENLNK